MKALNEDTTQATATPSPIVIETGLCACRHSNAQNKLQQYCGGVGRASAAAVRQAGGLPMRPYRASASAKMRMRIMPTKSFGCCALALRTTLQRPSRSTLHQNCMAQRGEACVDISDFGAASSPWHCICIPPDPFAFPWQQLQGRQQHSIAASAALRRMQRYGSRLWVPGSRDPRIFTHCRSHRKHADDPLRPSPCCWRIRMRKICAGGMGS